MEKDPERPQDDLLGHIEAFLRRGVEVSSAALPPVSARELQLSTAVVFLQLVRADRQIRQDEHLALGRALKRVLGFSDVEARVFVHLAEEPRAFERPFRELTAVLDQHCQPDQKKKIVHGLWRLAYSDAELEGHEEYLVRKIADLLHLSVADLIETKVSAREEFLGEEL